MVRDAWFLGRPEFFGGEFWCFGRDAGILRFAQNDDIIGDDDNRRVV